MTPQYSTIRGDSSTPQDRGPSSDVPSGESQKTLFILTLFGILLLIFLGNYTKQFQTGTIKYTQTSSTKTTIHLEENDIKLIIFDSIPAPQKGEKIKFQGKEEIYKGEKQIIINKIYHIKE